jgi:hypothetical protein
MSIRLQMIIVVVVVEVKALIYRLETFIMARALGIERLDSKEHLVYHRSRKCTPGIMMVEKR